LAIDYVNDYHCKVKDTMPLGELIPLAKRRDHCRYILEKHLQDGESKEQALNTTIEFQVRRPGGVESMEKKPSDALESTKVDAMFDAHGKPRDYRFLYCGRKYLLSTMHVHGQRRFCGHCKDQPTSTGRTANHFRQFFEDPTQGQ
jgi:hypothetical protein